MKTPSIWPRDWSIKKIGRADAFGGGAEYSVFAHGEQIATVFKGSRGWAYSSKFGSYGKRYSGTPSMLEALFDLAYRAQGYII
jgi:hypothetical protein